MIRLLAPWRDVDPTAFPVTVNEVNCSAEDCDDRTPQGRWLAGYFDDGAEPSQAEWEKAVAAAPAPPAPEVAPDLDALRAKVAAASTVATLRTATLAYLDALGAG
jgi:hypothetical protein